MQHGQHIELPTNISENARMYVTMKELLTARDQEEQLHTHHYKKTSDVVLWPLMMILIKFFLSVNLI